MAAPTIAVNLELNEVVSGEFVVGSSLVGGSDVIGDGLSDVSDEGVRVSIRRGRWGALYEDFEAGTISITLNNEDRTFDPVNAAGGYYGELVPGREVEVQANGITIVSGFVEDYDLEYDVSGRSVTLVRATDALGRMGAAQFDAWTNTATNAATKLHAICNRSEVSWPSPLRDFLGAEWDFGGDRAAPLRMQSDAVSWGSNALNYTRLIARTDAFSFLFASADGRLVLRPVFAWASTDNSWTPGASVATFGASGIQYQSIRAQYGSETLFAEVSVDYEGGTAQTSTIADPVAWRESYGPMRRLSIGGLLIDDQQVDEGTEMTTVTAADTASEMADDLLAYYDTPTYRITEISVELAGLGSTDQNTVLGIDIADAVDVSFTPNGVGAAIEQTLAVQGIAHEITPDSHVVTFALLDYLAA